MKNILQPAMECGLSAFKITYQFFYTDQIN